jgi:hypothetical protein
LCYIPNSYFSIKLVDYSVQEQLRDFIPALLSAGAMGIFMYVAGLVLQLGEFGYILVTGLAGAAFYVLTNYLVKTPSQLLMLQIVKEQYLKKRHLGKGLNHG